MLKLTSIFAVVFLAGDMGGVTVFSPFVGSRVVMGWLMFEVCQKFPWTGRVQPLTGSDCVQTTLSFVRLLRRFFYHALSNLKGCLSAEEQKHMFWSPVSDISRSGC